MTLWELLCEQKEPIGAHSHWIILAVTLALFFPALPPLWCLHLFLYLSLGLVLKNSGKKRMAAQSAWIAIWTLQCLTARLQPKILLDPSRQAVCEALLLSITALPEQHRKGGPLYQVSFSAQALNGRVLRWGQYLEISAILSNIQSLQSKEQGIFSLIILPLERGYYNEGRTIAMLRSKLHPSVRAKLLECRYSHLSAVGRLVRAFDGLMVPWLKKILMVSKHSQIIKLFASNYHERLKVSSLLEKESLPFWGGSILLREIFYRSVLKRKKVRGKAQSTATMAYFFLILLQKTSFLSLFLLFYLPCTLNLDYVQRDHFKSNLLIVLILFFPWLLLDPSALFFYCHRKIFSKISSFLCSRSDKEGQLSAALILLLRSLNGLASGIMMSLLWQLLFDEPPQNILIFSLSKLLHYFFKVAFPLLFFNCFLQFTGLAQRRWGAYLFEESVMFLDQWVHLLNQSFKFLKIFGLTPTWILFFITSWIFFEGSRRSAPLIPQTLLFKKKISFVCLSTLCKLSFLMTYFFSQPDERIFIEMLDVGHGLAIVIRKNSHALLLDTAANYGSVSLAQSIILPYLKARRIHLDAIFISHADNDHAGGLPFLTQIFPNIPVFSGAPLPIQAVILEKGMRLVWQNTAMDVLWPPKIGIEKIKQRNHFSLTLLVHLPDMDFLFTGDLDQAAEEGLEWGHLVQSQCPLVLQVPHHGSQTSCSWGFLKKLSPTLAINSCGHIHRLPHPNIERRFHQLKIPIYSTNREGRLRITSQDHKPILSCYRREWLKYWWKK